VIQINDEIMMLLPDERYSIEHQVERIAKIYKVYIEKNELKNDSLIEWISLFRQWISCP